jgi:hypothetical protein
VPNVLRVPALENCHPMPFVVKPERDDSALDRRQIRKTIPHQV